MITWGIACMLVDGMDAYITSYNALSFRIVFVECNTIIWVKFITLVDQHQSSHFFHTYLYTPLITCIRLGRKCRGFTVPFASAPIVHAVAPAAWWVCPLYEPFDARTRDLLGQDLEPCFGWEKERTGKNIHGYSWMIICLCKFLFYYSVFECFRCLWYVLFRRSYVECPSLAFDEYRTKADPPSELLSEPVASHVEVLRLPRSPSALMPQMSTQIMRWILIDDL